jgi:pseudaminic acid synthase
MPRSTHNTLEIGGRRIGPGEPPYLVAEMSANHGQDFQQAVKILEAAAAAGADAVKLQTYTPDTLTIDCDGPLFRIEGTIWAGRTLYDLYGEAYTPWEWLPKLQAIAGQLDLALFSTPFDLSAVDFLERAGVPAYKIASFELVDVPLLRRVARTGKPVLLSTGMATLAEIEEAVQTIREAGGRRLALLKCTSVYPASAEEMNLRTVSHMAGAFGVPVGLSDHSLNLAVPVTAVALGASIIEKHFTLSRKQPGPDSAFSLEPHEFRQMRQAVDAAHQALGAVQYGPSERELASRRFRRSLFVVEDVKSGERFTERNLRSVRPADGLPPRHLEEVLQRSARCDIPRGTPLGWNHVQ